MRMWGVDPKQMCQKHLCGEHLETHMFLGTLLKGISVDGYIRKGLFNPAFLKIRHDLLTEEMIRRGYKHNSPIDSIPIGMLNVPQNVEANELELKRRCQKCFKL